MVRMVYRVRIGSHLHGHSMLISHHLLFAADYKILTFCRTVTRKKRR